MGTSRSALGTWARAPENRQLPKPVIGRAASRLANYAIIALRFTQRALQLPIGLATTNECILTVVSGVG